MPSLNVHIVSNADDGHESTGSGFDTGDVVCGFGFGASLTAFFRFLAVTGPVSGAIIATATITVTVQTKSGTPDTTCFGVDVDDAAAFADPGNLPSAAPRTTASSPGPTATGVQVINVATQVQEIINRAGWASGNNMAFIVVDNTGAGNNDWNAEDFAEAGTGEAYLDIAYTDSAPPVPSTGYTTISITRPVRVIAY